MEVTSSRLLCDRCSDWHNPSSSSAVIPSFIAVNLLLFQIFCSLLQCITKYSIFSIRFKTIKTIFHTITMYSTLQPFLSALVMFFSWDAPSCCCYCGSRCDEAFNRVETKQNRREYFRINWPWNLRYIFIAIFLFERIQVIISARWFLSIPQSQKPQHSNV